MRRVLFGGDDALLVRGRPHPDVPPVPRAQAGPSRRHPPLPHGRLLRDVLRDAQEASRCWTTLTARAGDRQRRALCGFPPTSWTPTRRSSSQGPRVAVCEQTKIRARPRAWSAARSCASSHRGPCSIPGSSTPRTTRGWRAWRWPEASWEPPSWTPPPATSWPGRRPRARRAGRRSRTGWPPSRPARSSSRRGSLGARSFALRSHRGRSSPSAEPFGFTAAPAAERLSRQFAVASLDGLGLRETGGRRGRPPEDGWPTPRKRTQRARARGAHRSPRASQALLLDPATLRNLEIERSLRHGGPQAPFRDPGRLRHGTRSRSPGAGSWPLEGCRGHR